MDIIASQKKFTLYQYADETGLWIAVPNDYIPFIQQATSEYGNISHIPSDRTVRGIFITDAKSQLFDPNAEQNDITINRLIPI